MHTNKFLEGMKGSTPRAFFKSSLNTFEALSEPRPLRTLAP